MACWHLKHGRRWMIQWCADWWLSFGVHIDFRRRRRADGIEYGPYLDLHLGWLILSLGRNVVYSGDLQRVLSISRGGF